MRGLALTAAATWALVIALHLLDEYVEIVSTEHFSAGFDAGYHQLGQELDRADR
jgi:hypothetical protein